jgi:hypothetical protein
MTKRMTQTILEFTSSFLLPSCDARQPAGRYRVAYEEEMMESASRVAWQRIGAFIFLPAIDSVGLRRQMAPLSMTDLKAVLESASAEVRTHAGPEA